LTLFRKLGYKPQTMGEEAFIIDTLTLKTKGFHQPQDLPVPFYGDIPWEKEVEGFSPPKEKPLFKRLHPSLQALAMLTCQLKERHSSLITPQRSWAIFTASQLEKERDKDHLKVLDSPKKISPAAGLALSATGVNFLVARMLGIRFYQGMSISHVCASGNHLLGQAKRAIEEGVQLALLVTINSMGSILRAAYHNRLGIISKKGEIRPFHKDRDGTVMADGLAVTLVASSSTVRASGIEPWARIAGVGERADAYHMYGLDPEGEALQGAVEDALRDAKIMAPEVSLIKSHGTGTRQNEAVEGRVIDFLFSRRPPMVTALKPYMGHTVVASALLELSYLLKNIRREGKVPPIPTTPPSQVDPQFQGLDLILQKPRPFQGGYLLSMAAGFGGFYSTAVLEI